MNTTPIVPAYVAILHPITLDELQLTPKEKWKIQYRKQRMAKKGLKDPEVSIELGCFNGIKFIRTN